MPRKSPRRRKADVEEPKQDVVVHRAQPPVPPLVSEIIETLRVVAGRMIDIADAAAEAVTSRIERRA